MADPYVPLDIASGFYRSESLPLAAQRCVNWIPVIAEKSALDVRSLFDVPGIREITLNGIFAGENRGVVKMDDVGYFVNGTTLYSIDSDGLVTNLGSIPGSGRVSMATNGEDKDTGVQYVVIVIPGDSTYAYNKASGALLLVSGFRVADTVVFKDGYFVFSSSDGTVFFNSALNDPFTYDALDFGTAEINPDKIVAAHVNHNELFMLGEETIEIFQNVGGADFPFIRIPGANIQKGLHAKFSIAEFDNSFVFIGGGRGEKTSIYKVESSSEVSKIATSAIDSELQKFSRTEISNAFAMSFAFAGSYFAAFTIISTTRPSKTFVYDATTSQLTGVHEWHERQSGTTESNWRVSAVIDLFGELVVADLEDGRVGIMDKDVYTEYGDPIYRERASQPFSGQGLPIFVNELVLTMESGVGLNQGQGEDPQIRMDFSDNGSRTFSSEFPRSYGKIGEYDILPSWRRQGRIPRNRVVRFKTTEPVKSVLIKLEADFSA